MSKPSPRRLKKKKEREKLAKNKVLARRNVARSTQVEDNQYRKKLKKVEKLQKEMSDLNGWADGVFMRMNNNTLIQLEKNAKILKALESEYKKEMSKKQKLNNDLEEKGLLTLQEKLNHIHNESAEQLKSAGIELILSGEKEDIVSEMKSLPTNIESQQDCDKTLE